ncbi:hypothetical protein Patl1_26798 [Pistacia atlantica]|uniref:Uncharacterized protein n=1 Tax=Pistacia atlantica TaxID=434234 RepID=A0ACC1AYX8_9ROSI|nr:hypothetical protein Patl1_26798 [Pistacia atlantica]
MNHFSFLVIFLIIFHISQAPALACNEEVVIIRFKYKVHIINGFTSNENPLIAHCKSKDNDIGEHVLWMNNEFKFEFKKNIFGTTRFWCDMRHGSVQKTIDVFRVGHESYESVYCHYTGNCFWSTREDGFYFSNDNESWLKRYEWY